MGECKKLTERGALLKLFTQVKSARSFSAIMRKAMGWRGVPDTRVSSSLMNWGDKLHTWPGMIGYTMKDEHQPHFKHLHSEDVTDELKQEGRRQYMLYGRAPLKKRVTLSAENLFDRSEMFWRVKLGAVDCGIITVLREMIRSGEYFPSCTWVKSTNGSGMDLSRAQSIFRMIRDYEFCSSDDIYSVFFNEKGDHMSHGRLIKTPRMRMLERQAFYDYPPSHANVNDAVDALREQIIKLEDVLEKKEKELHEHHMLEEAQFKEMAREVYNPRKCGRCGGHGTGLLRPDGYCQHCFRINQEELKRLEKEIAEENIEQKKRDAKGKAPVKGKEPELLELDTDSDSEDDARYDAQRPKKLILGGRSRLLPEERDRIRELRRIRRQREAERDTTDGAGPSRISGDSGGAGPSRVSAGFSGKFTKLLYEMGFSPNGARRNSNDDIRDGEDNERLARETVARWESDAVHDKQRDEGIDVKPHGPRLPREQDFEEHVVAKKVVVLVEKDTAARVERDDMSEHMDIDMKKKKSVTWQDIDQILAPGREARTAALRRRRELTGNAFQGADFVDLTTGTPSWSTKGDDDEKTAAGPAA